MKEVLEKRTAYGKTFKISDNKYKLVASQKPLHILNNGKYVEINTKIKDYKIRDGIYDANISRNKIGFRVIDRQTSETIDLELVKLNDEIIVYKEPIIEKNKVIFKDISLDQDICFVFNRNKVRIYRILYSEQAYKKATWKVTENDNDKEINFKANFFGYDKKNRETIHEINISQKNNNSYLVEDSFTGKVSKINRKKRNKVEYNAEYPVIIDPTVDVFVNSDADDGYAYASTFSTGNFDSGGVVAYVTHWGTSVSNGESRAYTKFNGITIIQNSEITSATIKLITSSLTGTSPIQISVLAKDLNNPTAPSNFAQVFSPGTLASNVLQRNITTDNSGLKTIDVKDIVQELVNSYDYDNESMLFFYKVSSGTMQNSRGLNFWTFDSEEDYAELIIEYTTPLYIQAKNRYTGVKITY